MLWAHTGTNDAGWQTPRPLAPRSLSRLLLDDSEWLGDE